MTILYCRDDPVSGRYSGVDRLLTEVEVDYNFYQHETRIAVLEANYTLTISIASVTQPTSSTMRVTLTDATFTDITMPIAGFRSRGDWAVATAYLFNDTFNAPDGGLYQVIFDHTSDATSFDPNANDGAGHDYYAPMIPPRGNTIAAGGAVGMYYRKNSATDYVANWAYIQASEVVFSASTGSSLVSTNVAAALEELETLIGTGLANYLPLAGGTLTGALVLSADPASGLQAATKQYVDGIAANLGKRARVRLLDTTDSDPATSGYTNGATIDSVILVTGDQVLRNGSGHQARNGVWIVAASGGAIRASEFDTYDEHPGTLIAVEEGTVNADTLWLCTSNTGGTLNTTAIVFSAAGTGTTYSAGAGLSLTGTTFSIDGTIVGRLATANTWALAQTFTVAPVFTDASGTRTALGLGSAATHAATDFQTADAQLFSNIPQNSKSAAYTTVLTDAQKHILHPSADTTARTFTIDSNANVAYPIGTAITFVNQHSAGVVTIAITSDTIRLAGTGSTGSRTLAADGIATALKIATTEWIISGTGLT